MPGGQIDYRKTLLQVAKTTYKGRQLPTLFDHPNFNDICKKLIGGESLGAVAEEYDVPKTNLARFAKRFLRRRITRARRDAKNRLSDKFEEGLSWYWDSNKAQVEMAEEAGDLKRRDALMKGVMRHALGFLGRASGALDGPTDGRAAEGEGQTNRGVVIHIDKMFAVPHQGRIFEFEDANMEQQFANLPEDEIARRLLGARDEPEVVDVEPADE